MFKHNLLICHGSFRFLHRSRKDGQLGSPKLKICNNVLDLNFAKCTFVFKVKDHVMFCCADNFVSDLIKDAIEDYTGKDVKHVIPKLTNYHISGKIKKKTFIQMKTEIIPHFMKKFKLTEVGITSEAGAPTEVYKIQSRAAKQLLDPNIQSSFTGFFIKIEECSTVKFQQSGKNLCFTVITSKSNATASSVLDELESIVAGTCDMMQHANSSNSQCE